MQFQIYIPDVSAADPQHLARVGLQSLVQGAQFMDVREGPGGEPGGGPGVIAFWTHTGPGTLGYRPDTQDWQPAIAREGQEAGRYSIGFTNDSPPTPDELKRPFRQPGEWVTLGDGNDWLLPQLYRLPQDMICLDENNWRFEVQRQFHDVWLESQQWQPILAQQTDYTRNMLATLAEFVLKVLSINYRVTAEVANQLRLFSSGDAGTVVLAAVLVCNQTEAT